MPCSGCSVLHGGNSQWKEKNWGICKMQKLYSNPGYGSGTLWGQQNRKYQLFESMTLDLTSILLNILHGEKDIISYFLFEISVKNFTFSSKDNCSTSVLVTLTHSLLILPFSTPLKTVHFKFWFDKGPPPHQLKICTFLPPGKIPIPVDSPPTKFLFTPLPH